MFRRKYARLRRKYVRFRRKYARRAIWGLTNIGGEVASIYRHQRSINFNPQLSKIKVRRDHGDMDHDDDRPGDQVDHQGEDRVDHQGGDHVDHQGGHDSDLGDRQVDMDSR